MKLNLFFFFLRLFPLSLSLILLVATKPRHDTSRRVYVGSGNELPATAYALRRVHFLFSRPCM